MLRLSRVLLACALLSACTGRALAEVARASTPAEERDAFAALARTGGLGFTAYDAAGKQLDLSATRWWEKARRLTITADGGTLDHAVLDPENIMLLMQE